MPINPIPDTDADLYPLIEKMFAHISDCDDSVKKAWRLAETFFLKQANANVGKVINALNRSIDNL